MKYYLKRLKRELIFFLILGLIIAIVASFLYLLGNPLIYTTSAELTMSSIGQNIFKEKDFADEPERIFNYENLRFLSEKQKQNIEFDMSSNYKSLSIRVKGKSPLDICRVANIVAEAYKTHIQKEGRSYITDRKKEKLGQIDSLYMDYRDELAGVNGRLNKLEPQLEALQRQQDSVEDLKKSLKERIAKLEIRRAELLRIYTESHPAVISIDSEADSLTEKLKSLPVVNGIKALERDVSKEQAKYNKLQQELTRLEKEKESLSETIKEPPVVISQYATRPRKPIGGLDTQDVYKRFILSGLLIGLVISLSTAAIKDTIVSEFEISNIPGLPLIATVPFVKPKRGQKVKAITTGKRSVGTHLLFSHGDSSEYVNAYRSLTTHIKLDAFGGNIDKKVIILTSPDGKTGKSTVSANLAIVLARLGKRTVLLDANLNRTSVAKFFGIRARVSGISDILSGKANLEDCLKGVTDMLLGGVDWDMAMKTYGLDRLKILPSGRRVPDPAGLLESGAISELFGQLRERFDCIIVDSPGLLKSPDSIIFSPNADGILLICKTGSTSYRDLIKCSRKLAEIKIQFKGNILVCT